MCSLNCDLTTIPDNMMTFMKDQQIENDLASDNYIDLCANMLISDEQQVQWEK